MKKKKNILQNVNDLTGISKRILYILDKKNITGYQLEKNNSGITATQISHIKSGRNQPSTDLLEALLKYVPTINKVWLLTGVGPEEIGNEVTSELLHESVRNIIPLYDEVGTIGGQKTVANMDGVSQPSDYVDTGDWFRDATAAIRHYEDSMSEYPSGCILAVKKVKDLRLIVPGRDYVIETSEFRVTKKVQTVPGGVFFVAHSTNLDTYPNGTLIHPPFEVPWDAVISISLVLGYVVNKNGGKVFYNSLK